ncbi:chromatin assembly factor 1 subunit A-B [Odontomachus brunneus]|uniref:chromatin assembly factor 1 subunit A-B n=1 Tax=Odontomachus brunneus TaxID=486640 RepID=UPI0013F29A3D|nr:chromatin assembly factor 1 subunit A-B [Odontomachus brunneus]
MDVSVEDDCTVEVITHSKKKTLKQAQLPFQTLSASKSPNSTNNMPNKKRKVVSPLEEIKNSKMIKYAKENSAKDISEEKEKVEEKSDTDSECIELISDQEEKDLEQSSEQNDEEKTKIETPKRNFIKKNKTLKKSQKKSGALTKFLTKADSEPTSTSLKSRTQELDCQNTSREENGEIPLSLQSLESPLHMSHVSKEMNQVNVIENPNISQESDSDIAILSSDDEAPSELDKSITSINEEKTIKSPIPTTPKSGDKDEKIKFKKLTPKQLEKRQEIAKRKEEKAKLKMEKEKKRLEEKADRRRKREEKQKQKEEKEKLEKQQKKKEKEMKELKKQMEIEQKQKEKEAKEEERRRREEEKRKKEEEKLEAERKKQKAASNFASFFVSKKQEAKSTEEESDIEAKNFMPFEVKVDMRVAPVCRRMLSKQQKSLLDEKCNAKDTKRSELYLEDVRKGRIVPRTSSKTWPLETKDDDIVILDEDNNGNSNIIMETHHLEKHRPKLLQFDDNRRPPYWGTWRKQSNVIKPRQPFVKDQKWFDYDIDSDEEWEEEEPGESLKGSDDEKDEENPEDNEYDVDNEFMVPHGYLSDEEARADEEEMEDMSPQTQKMKLKLLGEQFEAERKVKTHKLQPKIIGCVWQGPSNGLPDGAPTKLREFVSSRQIWVSHVPMILPSSVSTENNAATGECKTPSQQPSGRSAKKSKLPDETSPSLVSGELMRNWLGFRSETRVSD